MKKKYIMSAALLFSALLLAVLSRHSSFGGMQRYEATFLDVFDTVTSITGYAKSEEIFTEQVELLHAKLQRYHQLFDIYHSYEGVHNMKDINDAAGRRPVEADPEVIELLKLGQDMYRRTEGKVNIAYGSVLAVWHEYREAGIENPQNAQLPPADLLGACAEHTDISKLVIDEGAGTVFLEDEEMRLDVGSIGKGFAAQRLAEYAREIGMEHVLFSLGGNVCAVGAKADGTPWRVGIEKPRPEAQGSYVQAVELAGRSLVTSGDYQRYYEVDGRRYCHIINPETGMPAEFFPSVTVMAEDSGMADAFSTALFVMGQEEGLALVEELEDVEALWVMEDGGIRCSSGFGIDEEE